MARKRRIFFCTLQSFLKGNRGVRFVGLCHKNDLRTGDPSQFLFLIGQFQKLETPTLLMLGYRLCQRLELALYESCSLP